MNRKIGMYASLLNFISVLAFAVSMLAGFDFGSYFSSMFIALSFVTMTCAFAYFSDKSRKVAGIAASAFAVMYAGIILLVYFAQLTTVRLDELSGSAGRILDFGQFGLFFNYDLLGYALMSLAMFFAGLTVNPCSKADRWLKILLLVHGVFFVSCLVMPMLGVFKAGSPEWIGAAVLEFWCVYFMPVGILSYVHFSRCGG